MKSAQIIDCVSLATIEKSFQEVRAEAEVLILAAITGFLLEEGFNGTIFSTIDPVLATFATKLLGFCAARPNLQVLSQIVFKQIVFRYFKYDMLPKFSVTADRSLSTCTIWFKDSVGYDISIDTRFFLTLQLFFLFT